MRIGMIGLGKMGGNMARRLLGGGHEVAGYSHGEAETRALEAEGLIPAFSLAELAEKLSPPRVCWMMVPAGEAVGQTLADLAPILAAGDVIVDGGNSRYTDSVRREHELASRGLHFVDCGTSGGIWGLAKGYCMMLGGDAAAIAILAPVLTTLAPPDGWRHVGAAGAGHFVKMIHNGIEYGLLQAYAEGFELLHASPYGVDLGEVAHLWNQGSVVRSWLLELAERTFAKEADLASVRGYVEDSGEGRWMVAEAIERGVPAPIITLSLLARFASRQEESFSAKVIAALRGEFGGHAVKKDA